MVWACRGAIRASFGVLWTAALLGGLSLERRCRGPKYQSRVCHRWLGAWGRGILPAFGVSVVSVDALKLPRGTCLVVANHRSPLDIPLILAYLNVAFLSRHDVADWPLVGWAARQVDTVFVDRDDRRSGLRAIQAMRRRLHAGRNILAFPEGTTFAGDEVRPFHGGALVAAREDDVSVVPLGLAYPSGTEFVEKEMAPYFRKLNRWSQIPVGICVGTPLAPKVRTDPEAARQAVQNCVERARAAVSEGH